MALIYRFILKMNLKISLSFFKIALSKIINNQMKRLNLSLSFFSK